MGTVVCGDGWVGDSLETSCRDRCGDVGIRVPGTVGDGYKYLSPCSSVVGSVYGVLSPTQTVSEIKSTVWQTFVRSLTVCMIFLFSVQVCLLCF